MKAREMILIGSIFLTTACTGTAQTTIAQTDQARVSPERRVAKANQKIAAAPNDNDRTRQPPESVIKDIYAIHLEDVTTQRGDRIVNSESRSNLDKFFDKKLADLIWYDLTAERGEDDEYEVGVVDFDLFYATQEDDLPALNLRINRARIETDQATVRVYFTSGGTKETVEYTLVEQNGAWKISDIKYRTGMSLLERFAEATRKGI